MVLATLYMGGYLMSNNQVSPGELMSFLVATQTIQRSLTQLSLLFGQVVKGLVAGARVFEVSTTAI
jgi:ATP-binding cassette subfamily B (MDR/TAP) protein 8